MTKEEQEIILQGGIQMPDVLPYQAAQSVEKLIVKLCDDVTTGKVRDEYKTCEVIAHLMTSIKPNIA